jgi:dipeptidyl aminopeptidase/acylaminoacyl peptidase
VLWEACLHANNHKLVFTVLVGWIGFVLTLPAAAQTGPKPLPVEEIAGMKTVHLLTPPAPSPDGTLIAYCVQDGRRVISNEEGRGNATFTETGAYNGTVFDDIFLTDLRTGEVRNLTAGRGGNCNPSWSPDGRLLVFFSDRGGKAQLWAWEHDGDRLRAISDVVVRVPGPRVVQWTPDGKSVLVPVLPEDMSVDVANALPLRSFQGPSWGDQGSALVYHSESRPGGYDAERAPQTFYASLDRYVADLAMINISTGKVRRIARKRRLGSYALSPSGNEVAFIETRRMRDDNSTAEITELFLCRVDQNTCQNLASGTDLRQFSFSPDGKFLAYLPTVPPPQSSTSATYGQRATPPVTTCLVIAAIEGNVITEIPCSSNSRFTGQPFWNTSGSQVFLSEARGIWRIDAATHEATLIVRTLADAQIQLLAGRSPGELWYRPGSTSRILAWNVDSKTFNDGLREIDLSSGESRILWEQDRSKKTALAFSVDMQHLFWFAQQAQRPAELWQSQIDGPPKLILDLNPEFGLYNLGTAQLVEWHSLDGLKIRAELLLPGNYERGRRYPLILGVYGGALSSHGMHTFDNGSGGSGVNQLLASRGYAVLIPDAPQNGVAPMQEIANSVLPGIDLLADMGIIDPDRIGIIGHSYGGYSTLALIVTTTRFKAAVAISGFSDIASEYGALLRTGEAYGIPLAETGQGKIGAPPWDNPRRYIENSPYYYLNRVQTPLLLIHGTEDSAVPVTQSDQVFVGLRRLNKEATYVKYEGQDHLVGNWPYAIRVDYFNRILAWFDQHLKSSVSVTEETKPRSQ